MGRSKTVRGEDRTMVLRVLRYFEAEKEKQDFLISVDKVLKRTCAATGVSLSTLMRIKREEKQILKTTPASPSPPPKSPEAKPSVEDLSSQVKVQLPTPGIHRPPCKHRIEVDSALISSLRKIIDKYERTKNEKPTLRKILAMAKSELDFKGQRETLRRIITTKLGYNLKRPVKEAKKADVVYGTTEDESVLAIKIERLSDDDNEEKNVIECE